MKVGLLGAFLSFAIIICIGKLIAAILICGSTHYLTENLSEFKDVNLNCTIKTSSTTRMLKRSRTSRSRNSRSSKSSSEQCNNLGQEKYPYKIFEDSYLCKKETIIIPSSATEFEDPELVRDEFADKSTFWRDIGTLPIVMCVLFIAWNLFQIGNYIFFHKFYTSDDNSKDKTALKFLVSLYMSIYWLGATAGIFAVLSIEFKTCIEFSKPNELPYVFKWKIMSYITSIFGGIFIVALVIYYMYMKRHKDDMPRKYTILFYLIVVIPYFLLLAYGIFNFWVIANMVVSTQNEWMVAYSFIIVFIEVIQLICELMFNHCKTDDHREDIESDAFKSYKEEKINERYLRHMSTYGHQRDAPPPPNTFSEDSRNEDEGNIVHTADSLPHKEIEGDLNVMKTKDDRSEVVDNSQIIVESPSDDGDKITQNIS